MLKKLICALVFTPILLIANIGYVANYGSDTVSVFDTQKQKTFKTIAVGKQPHGTWLSDNNAHLYVANMGSNSVSVIDTATNKKIKDITVGLAPVELVSTNGYIYTADSKSNTVSIIDEKTFKFVKKLSVGIQPEGMERSKDGNTIYVSNTKSKSITVIDTKQQVVTKTIDIPSDAHNLRLSTNEKLLYVTSPSAHKIIVIDTKTLKVSGEIALNKTSNPVEIATSSSYIYVSSTKDGTLYKIDAKTHKITANLVLGGDLHGLNFYKENEIILSHSTSNTIALVNVHKMVAHSKINVGLDPRGMLVLPMATSFDPSDNATNVSISINLVLTLDQTIPTPVPTSLPNITLYKTADDSVVETFNTSTGTGSSGGSSTIANTVLTLNPNADLDYSTSYYIANPISNRITTSGGIYTIYNNSTWNFTTESAPASTPTTTLPEEEEEEAKLDHRVKIGDVQTRVVTFLPSAITAKLPEGVIRTTAGHVDIGNGYYVLAVADTTPDGRAITYFLKVSETDPTDITVIGYTYSAGTPFPLGTLIEIQKIDGILYIVITSPLSGTPLTVQ